MSVKLTESAQHMLATHISDDNNLVSYGMAIIAVATECYHYVRVSKDHTENIWQFIAENELKVNLDYVVCIHHGFFFKDAEIASFIKVCYG